MNRKYTLPIFVVILGLTINSFASDEPEPQVVSAHNPVPVAASALPPYMFRCENGLSATLNGYLNVKSVQIPGQQTHLLTVPGLAAPLPVSVVMQDHPAPLVVVLLGISGEAKSDFSKLWPSWYADAGYNVLTFDSSFRPEFIELGGSKVGVAGNIWAESAMARDIIQAFLDRFGERMAPTKIGIVGMSYGGTEALILGQMAAEGKVSFKIDGIQAYSPPADLRQSARIIDGYYNRHRFDFTLIEMKKEVEKHHQACGELPDDLMRAALATSFETALSDAVLATDHRFGLSLFSKDPELRKDESMQWGFERYAYDLALPWWRQRLGSDQIDDLVVASNLENLLKHQPSWSQAIIAADDPLNDPVDTQVLRAHMDETPLTILPNGGHLGYIADPWTHAKLLTLFDDSAVKKSSAR